MPLRNKTDELPVRTARVVRMREREQDPSGNTAQFRAFADGRSADDAVPPPWTMRAQRSQVVKLTAAVIVVALILAVIAFVFIG
jgi:hypothetical protein